MKIEIDTTSLGTPEQPAFLVFPKYGKMPSATVILAAKTAEEAKQEVKQRFGVEGVL